MIAVDLGMFAAESERPLRRAEYDALVRLGCFDSERVELLCGRIVPMSPRGVAHGEALRRLNKILSRALGDRADVQIQSPIAAADESEPEPDVALVPPGPYTTDHPSHPWLVIEVADSSLRRDRLKAALYAASAIPEYWLIDLQSRTVQVHWEPVSGSYRQVKSFSDAERIPLQAFDEVTILVSDILPPA